MFYSVAFPTHLSYCHVWLFHVSLTRPRKALLKTGMPMSEIKPLSYKEKKNTTKYGAERITLNLLQPDMSLVGLETLTSQLISQRRATSS